MSSDLVSKAEQVKLFKRLLARPENKVNLIFHL